MFSSVDSLKNFLARFVSDPLAGILRRVEFFATHEPLVEGDASDLDAVPLQAFCSQRLTVSPPSLYFSDTQVNSSSSGRYFTISNPNGCPVDYSLSVPDGFSVSRSSGKIPANDLVSITVTFTPYSVWDYSGYINVSPQGSVYVKGRGIKRD